MPDIVQTSPYLTLVRPNRESPVIFMTDTAGAEVPDVFNAPAGSTVGVVDLRRQVSWFDNDDVAQALEQAALAPMSTHQLAQQHGGELIDELVRRDWLQKPSDLCREYFIYSGEIEITAHCNWGCEFCPVSVDPKPREVMPMRIFDEIVEKLADNKDLRYVTFHFFNEPTLDPHFGDRIKSLQRYGLKLDLFSNLSALTPAKADMLEASGVMYYLVANIPSLDQAQFESMTGSKTYRQSIRNLEHVINTASYPVAISVNGVGPAAQQNLDEIRATYADRGVEVFPTLTCDRAGTMLGQYAQSIYVEGPLRGCNWPVNHLYFSVRGNTFLCCNDYYQREVFGSISDGSIHDIMTSEAAISLRRRVFGVEEAPQDFVCRSCHDQCTDFPHRQFRPIATFPLAALD